MKVQAAIWLSLYLVLSSTYASHLVYFDHPIPIVKNQKEKSSPEQLLQSVLTHLNNSHSAENYQLKAVRESLLGTHYYFSQQYHGYVIEDANLTFSLNQQGQLTKAYDTSRATTQMNKALTLPLMNQTAAIEVAWKNLGVNGQLTHEPQVALQYDQNMHLVYNINLSVSSPRGNWQVQVDAGNGTVLSVRQMQNMRMINKQGSNSLSPKEKTNFQEELIRFRQKKLHQKFISKGTSVNGTAEVFDPNPVVTLERTDLEDSSASSEFSAAYVNETLNDITLENGVYKLDGPKIKIVDFESPNTAPSTTTDGIWNKERGDSSFNDAMTYFHIDRSIRHMEDIGFTGNKVIFDKQLQVDADAVNGDDNSYYDPSTKELAYGHGCVDDNEDTEVILHELGHAIQDHINPLWDKGDTGAMGEGFGDYWAATASYESNHANRNVNWVYTWDGHNKCWDGRKLNAKLTYNKTKTYEAHVPMGNDVSDELWSTPLYQAYMELRGKGVSKDDLDKIILESHFGLGSGVTMPDMANATINAAKALFPKEAYDKTYEKHFKDRKIL